MVKVFYAIIIWIIFLMRCRFPWLSAFALAPVQEFLLNRTLHAIRQDELLQPWEEDIGHTITGLQEH